MCLSLIRLSGRDSKRACFGEGSLLHIVAVPPVLHGVDDRTRAYVTRSTEDTKLESLMAELDLKVLLWNQIHETRNDEQM